MISGMNRRGRVVEMMLQILMAEAFLCDYSAYV